MLGQDGIKLVSVNAAKDAGLGSRGALPVVLVLVLDLIVLLDSLSTASMARSCGAGPVARASRQDSDCRGRSDPFQPVPPRLEQVWPWSVVSLKGGILMRLFQNLVLLGIIL